MGISALFKERKYPFGFALTVLFVCVTVLLFTNSTPNPLFLYSDLKASSLQPQPSNPIASPAKKDVVSDRRIAAVNITWTLCPGPLSVDYIPCLDNFKAIKALKSRRHMEHRERHCPKPIPRCLAPLPRGYKVKVPWPKSRDMVSFLVW